MKHEQLFSGYATEESDILSLNNHQLPIDRQGKMETHALSPILYRSCVVNHSWIEFMSRMIYHVWKMPFIKTHTSMPSGSYILSLNIGRVDTDVSFSLNTLPSIFGTLTRVFYSNI